MAIELLIVRAKDRNGFMATVGQIDTAIGGALLRWIVGPVVSATRRKPQQLARVAGVVTGVCWMATATGEGVFAKVNGANAFTFGVGVLCGLLVAYWVVRRSRDIEKAIGQGPDESGAIPAGLLLQLTAAARMRVSFLFLIVFVLVIMGLSPPGTDVVVVEVISYVFMMIAWYFASTVMTPPPKRERVRVRGLVPLGVPSR